MIPLLIVLVKMDCAPTHGPEGVGQGCYDQKRALAWGEQWLKTGLVLPRGASICGHMHDS
jgi:hypothetical protein